MHEGEARLFNVLGVSLVGLGEIDAGLDQMRTAVRIARASGLLETLLGPSTTSRSSWRQTDRFDEGSRWRTRALDAGKRVGLERRYGVGLRASAGDISSGPAAGTKRTG